jgi:hypothetical protein
MQRNAIDWKHSLEVGEIPLSLVADCDILSHHQHLSAESVHENPFDKFLRRDLRKIPGEVNSVEELNTKLAEPLPLLSKTTERSRLFVTFQDSDRMGIKRNYDTGPIARHAVERHNDMAMPQMNPIEVPEGNDPVLEAWGYRCGKTEQVWNG